MAYFATSHLGLHFLSPLQAYPKYVYTTYYRGNKIWNCCLFQILIGTLRESKAQFRALNLILFPFKNNHSLCIEFAQPAFKNFEI